MVVGVVLLVVCGGLGLVVGTVRVVDVVAGALVAVVVSRSPFASPTHLSAKQPVQTKAGITRTIAVRSKVRNTDLFIFPSPRCEASPLAH